MQQCWGKYVRSMVAMVAFLLIVSPALAGEKTVPENTVAIVNGSIITEEDFSREMQNVQMRYLKMGRNLSDAQLSEMKESVLESLINRELLYQESEKKGITIKDEVIDNQIMELKKSFPNEAEFKNALNRMNFSECALKSQIKKDLAVQQFITTHVASKINLSDSAIKEYYTNNPNLFKEPERVKASHILIKFEPTADSSQKAEAHSTLEKIQERSRKGEDFGALAKEASQCPSNAQEGDLGYFGRGQMVKPFEDVAFSLKPGEVSDIVETQFGYHLIKVTDKKKETVIAYNEIKDKLKTYLKDQKTQVQLKQFADNLKEMSDVKTFPKNEPK